MRFTLDLSNRRTFLIALLLFSLAITIFVMASPGDTPNPGHDATQVRGGTFRNSSYTFPKNLTVRGNFTVGTNSSKGIPWANGRVSQINNCPTSVSFGIYQFAECVNGQVVRGLLWGTLGAGVGTQENLVETSAIATTIVTQTFSLVTTGTAAVGLGSAFDNYLENAAGIAVIGSHVETKFSTATTDVTYSITPRTSSAIPSTATFSLLGATGLTINPTAVSGSPVTGLKLTNSGAANTAERILFTNLATASVAAIIGNDASGAGTSGQIILQASNGAGTLANVGTFTTAAVTLSVQNLAVSTAGVQSCLEFRRGTDFNVVNAKITNANAWNIANGAC